MSVTIIHNRYTLLLRYGSTLLLMLICGMLSLNAQGGTKTSLQFFEDKAWQDATFEQGLHWSNAEDELDFWKDQRKFEERLMKSDRAAYLAYLSQKKEAYLQHRESCDKSCEHGDFYYLQASYYTQYKAERFTGPGAAVVLEYSPTDRNPE